VGLAHDQQALPGVERMVKNGRSKFIHNEGFGVRRRERCGIGI
jgi:hypothetical protein